MSFKYFNLRNVKKLINSQQSSQPKSPERRQFVKNMGFGVLATNPILKTISSFSNQSFDIKHQHNYFAVVRDKKVVWEISPNFFGDKFKITLKQDDNTFLVKAKNLQIVHTNLHFDLEARIYKDISDWQLQFKIPQFDIDENLDFINWLDGMNTINSSVYLNTNLFNLNQEDKIDLNGAFDCKISRDWEFTFKDKGGVLARINNLDYISNNLIISPNQDELSTIIPSKFKRNLKITIDGEQHWNRLLANMNLANSHHLNTVKDIPNFNFSLGSTENGENFKALWISEQDGSLQYLDSALATSGVSFSKYFYLSDYNKGKTPEFFLSAKMADTNQWLTNSIGSFELSADKKDTELELFGVGNRVIETRLEPVFKSFQPKILGALALPSFQETTKIRLDNNSSSQQIKIKKQFKSVKKDQAIISTQAEKIEFSPKKPIRIKVLRPEDMVYLEFEFYNFKFVGEASTNIPINIGKDPKKPINTIRDPKKPINTGKVLKRPTSTNKVLKRPTSTNKVFIKPTNNSISAIRVDSSTSKINAYNPNAYTAIELDDSKKKGTIIIYFPTQHTLEEAFFETNDNLKPENEGYPNKGDEIKLPVKHLRAKRSRLVYELEAEHKGFELSMTELLDWSKFKLKVDRRAWIKFDNITAINKPTYTLPANLLNRNREVNRKTDYLDKNNIGFGVQLTQQYKTSSKKINLYETNTLNKILISKEAATINPNYKILEYLPLKVEQISEMNTSIEAPALLYISPNQVNDFHHKIDLDETAVYSQYSISKGADVIKPIQRSNELSIKPIRKIATRNISFTSNAPGNITELWHTHLGVKMKNGKTSTQLNKLKTIRALWAHDARPEYAHIGSRNVPFRASLDANNRHKLVHLTSNYGITNYKPQPVPVKKLILSNLGAYLEWQAHFKTPTGDASSLNIVEWEHQATLGRDHYVKIVEEGYLFPFGHRAALVTVTERKFDTKTKAAVNKQRKYIVVLQDMVTYERNDPNNTFIKFPFQEVRITVNKTPNIDKPIDSILHGNGDRLNFLIKVGNRGFHFDMVVTDKEGDEKHLRMPLAFVENSVGINKSYMTAIINKYNEYDTAYTDINFLGQEIAYSESLVGGDTSFETKSMLFGAMVYPAKKSLDLKFHPIMQSSKIFIESVDKITNSRNPVEISLEDDHNAGDIFASVLDAVVDFSGGSDSSGGFLTPNMPINAISKVQGAIGGVLEDLKELKFSPASVFGGVDDVVNGLDEAADLLGRLDNLPIGKIFGVINLASLFLDIDLDTAGLQAGLEDFKAQVAEIKEKIEDLKDKILYYENLAKQTIEDIEAEFNNIENMVNMDVQEEVDAYIQEQIDLVKEQIKTEAVNLVNKLAEKAPKIPNLKTYITESAFFAEYKYQPEFDGNDNEPIVILENLLQVEVADKKKALTINTILEKPFELEKPPTLKTSARFDNFGIDIVPLLKVNFNYLEFKAGTGTKTDVKVDMNLDNPIEFKGALSFVNSLQNVIPSGGFSDDGPYVDLQPTGVKAGFNISIPNIEVGVCMITNLSLGAYVMLPFTGAPLTLGFNFCTRENPFLLTISAFGGGGYFLMITTLEGIQSMEAAFEFGAAMSMNVGVASGSVSVMGGFYFKMELVKEEVNGEEVEISNITLTGYLRMNGRLSILGLINASLEFYLALNAIIVDGKVEKMEGTATVKIKVEVLFFSKTVSVTVRRELKGADADPKFVEMIDQDDWQEYCLAFAS